MKRTALFCIMIGTVGLGGCAAVAVDPKAGFPEVSRLVAERAGQEIAWTPGAEGTPPALEAIGGRRKDGLGEEGAVQIAFLNNRQLHALYAGLGIARSGLV